MRLQSLAVVAVATLAGIADAIAGKTYTSWNCCKGVCASSGNVPSGTKGLVRTCDVNNNFMAVAQGAHATSACSNGGTGFLCDDYQPVPVSENVTYGFGIMFGREKCCGCYQLQWTSGSARGKSVVFQVIDIASDPPDPKQAVRREDVILMTPGGGGGATNLGCRAQYGTSWGKDWGGVAKREDCEKLPQNLQSGCYWRWNWARGDVNGWNIDYKPVSCPARLTSISGCG